MKVNINSCGIYDCKPEWSWQTEKTGFRDYDLWTVFRGEGILSPDIEGATPIPVHEGTSILLEPNVCYKAYHDPKSPLLVISVHFDFLDDDNELFFSETMQTKLIQHIKFFEQLLLRMVSFHNSENHQAAHTYLKCALEEFYSAEPLSETNHRNPWTKIIEEICHEIDNDSSYPPLSYLAKKYGYTERYVGKMFKNIKGINFSEYCKNSRIGKAKTLLRLTNLSIHQISEQLSFYDDCHFTRAFKAATGKSPLAFRKQK